MKRLFVDKSPLYVDPIFSVTSRFEKCTNPKKINLGVGVYRNAEGQSCILNVVKKVEAELANNPAPNKNYLPITGNAAFVNGVKKLIFGENNDKNFENIQGVQTISGTGALRLAVEFVSRYNDIKTLYHPSPTWPIHLSMIDVLEIKNAKPYKYYDSATFGIAWNKIMKSLESAPSRSAIILQLCGHNPTGADPSEEQWKAIVEKIINKEILPIFDVAYLGLGSGSMDIDAYPVRLMHSLGGDMMVCVSFSKIMSLYNERVGALLWYSNNKEAGDMVKNRLTIMIRNMYSNPPNYGAKIAERILNDDHYFNDWKNEVQQMSHRIRDVRNGLFQYLAHLKTPGDWSFITRQRGLFTYTEENIEYIEEKYGLFMPASGRINVSALTYHNLDYVAQAIHDAVTRPPVSPK